jgi:hypothetical protein
MAKVPSLLAGVLCEKPRSQLQNIASSALRTQSTRQKSEQAILAAVYRRHAFDIRLCTHVWLLCLEHSRPWRETLVLARPDVAECVTMSHEKAMNVKTFHVRSARALCTTILTHSRERPVIAIPALLSHDQKKNSMETPEETQT